MSARAAIPIAIVLALLAIGVVWAMTRGDAPADATSDAGVADTPGDAPAPAPAPVRAPVVPRAQPGKDAPDRDKMAWLRFTCPRAPCFDDVNGADRRAKRTRAAADVAAFRQTLDACMHACASR